MKILKYIYNIVVHMLPFNTLSNKDSLAKGQITAIPINE